MWCPKCASDAMPRYRLRGLFNLLNADLTNRICAVYILFRSGLHEYKDMAGLAMITLKESDKP